MKLPACFLFAFVASLPSLRAQSLDSLGVISGSVADSITGKPVPFITVSLFKDSLSVDGTLTDSVGSFAFQDVDPGRYHLRFSGVGYRPLRTPTRVLTPSALTWQAGRLLLGQDVTTLQTVTVVGQKPLIEQRVDGINFNAESLPPVAGSDAADVLRQVPLLVVDANGGLSMRGSSRIRVFINGKPSDFYGSVADALKSVPGSSIVRVEVITHPSARYDAEGTDGVVNIITRKARKNATSGELESVPGNRSVSLYGSIQHQRGRWLTKADSYYQTYWNRNGTELERATDQLRLVHRSESRQKGRNFFGGASALYSLDSLNTLNVGYSRRWTPNRTRTVQDNFQQADGPLVPTFQRQIDSPQQSGGHTFTAGYNGRSKDAKREWSLLGLYALTDHTNRYDFQQGDTFGNAYREDFTGQSLGRNLVLQADYTRTFGKDTKWESGGKITRSTLSSDSRFGVYDFISRTFADAPARSTAFAYRSTIPALYTSFSFSVSRWQFVTGARYEITRLDAAFDGFPLRVPSFHNLVPNLLASRKLTEKSTLKLGYTVRLARPNVTYLNPTVLNSDSLNLQFGNPYLRPELTRRYQLNYSRSVPKLFKDAVLFYHHNRHSIETIRTARPDGVFETTFRNVGRNQGLGLSVTLNWKPSPKLTLGGTLTAQQVWLASPAMRLSNRGLTRQFVPTANYIFPKGYSLYFYGFFGGPAISLQGRRQGWRYYTLRLSKESRNKRLNISLRMDTPLTRYTFIDEETVTLDFRQRQTSRYQNQNIRLAFSCKLGRQEIKGPRVRQAESPE